MYVIFFTFTFDFFFKSIVKVKTHKEIEILTGVSTMVSGSETWVWIKPLKVWNIKGHSHGPGWNSHLLPSVWQCYCPLIPVQMTYVCCSWDLIHDFPNHDIPDDLYRQGKLWLFLVWTRYMYVTNECKIRRTWSSFDFFQLWKEGGGVLYMD